MQEVKCGTGPGKLDLIIIAAFLAVEELRNAVVMFLASQDVLTLAALMGIVWIVCRRKLNFNMGLGIGKLRLFDGFLMKTEK